MMISLLVEQQEDPVPYAHGLAKKAGLRNSRLITLEGRRPRTPSLDWPVVIDAIVEPTSDQSSAYQSE